jgi:acyl-CoA reductase-like NAD-dependent aldehyde dehydrogenase
MISLTGSTETGKDVMKRASKGLKKVVLELGGSDSFIVCKDADLESAVKSAISGRFYNCGQVCSSAKRFYIEEGVAEEFIQRFKEGTSALKVGNPLEHATRVGPLVSADQRSKLEKQVSDSMGMGAKALCGGKRPDNVARGYFYLPTILTGTNHKMRVMREETFGPVAAVMQVKNIKQAIKLANDSVYGLAATVWAKDDEKAREISNSLEVGTVWLNKAASFYPQMPWGGVKASGIGREYSKYGMLELVNIKSII